MLCHSGQRCDLQLAPWTRGLANDLAAIVASTIEAAVLCAAVVPPFLRFEIRVAGTIAVLPHAVASAPTRQALAYAVARASTLTIATTLRGLGSSSLI